MQFPHSIALLLLLVAVLLLQPRCGWPPIPPIAPLRLPPDAELPFPLAAALLPPPDDAPRNRPVVEPLRPPLSELLPPLACAIQLPLPRFGLQFPRCA